MEYTFIGISGVYSSLPVTELTNPKINVALFFLTQDHNWGVAYIGSKLTYVRANATLCQKRAKNANVSANARNVHRLR